MSIGLRARKRAAPASGHGELPDPVTTAARAWTAFSAPSRTIQQVTSSLQPVIYDASLCIHVQIS
jgi:hypothetical protein